LCRFIVTTYGAGIGRAMGQERTEPMRNITREFYIPEGGRKVSSKSSSAVAYLYERNGAPCAVAFFGKAAKPLWRYRFTSEQQRERRIAALFRSAAEREQAAAARKAERQAAGRGLEVGDVLKTCWGYEQTNVEWFQVTALIGKRMVELREIAADAEETGWLRGNTVPMVDSFKGEPIRRNATNGAVRIDDVRHAWKVEPLERIGGKAVYEAASFTAYH
jgi:hypothetical protein